MFAIQVITLFPELFEGFQKQGLVSRAVGGGLLTLTPIQLRDFAINTHGQIDDTPYGGGSGMIMRPESAVAAIQKAKEEDPDAKVILFTPRGRQLNQKLVREIFSDCYNKRKGLILLCPRYEGVDERIAENYVDLELSIGDYILMGGEVPAMALIESVTRLIPDVLNNPDSTIHESFENGMLEHPQYTKPQNYQGMQVPPVLLSGNHQEIESWRRERAAQDTIARRPDLLKAPFKPRADVSLALIHYPVMNKEGKIITSSITNIDLHDIARSSRTFGVEHFYVVHPVRALRKLAEKICQHWAAGYGLQYNPTRSDALSIISLVPDFDDVLLDIETRTGQLPEIVVTSARKQMATSSYKDYRAYLMSARRPQLILFGTGWGLAQEFMSRADRCLEPIVGPTEFNHLSVRGAASIILDRLFGEK